MIVVIYKCFRQNDSSKGKSKIIDITYAKLFLNNKMKNKSFSKGKITKNNRICLKYPKISSKTRNTKPKRSKSKSKTNHNMSVASKYVFGLI